MQKPQEIIILANSIKEGAFCVAGKTVESGEWVRPVSTPDGGALDNTQVQIQNRYGTFMAKPLQKAFIFLRKHAPLPHQPENFLIGNERWKQHYGIQRRQLEELLDAPDSIWDYSSWQDRVPERIFVSGRLMHHQSLYLIRPETLVLEVRRSYSGYPKVVGSFHYNKKEYTFSVTDPAYGKYRKKSVGYRTVLKAPYLTLSLGSPFQGNCYKLIAAIL